MISKVTKIVSLIVVALACLLLITFFSMEYFAKKSGVSNNLQELCHRLNISSALLNIKTDSQVFYTIYTQPNRSKRSWIKIFGVADISSSEFSRFQELSDSSSDELNRSKIDIVSIGQDTTDKRFNIKLPQAILKELEPIEIDQNGFGLRSNPQEFKKGFMTLYDSLNDLLLCINLDDGRFWIEHTRLNK